MQRHPLPRPARAIPVPPQTPVEHTSSQKCLLVPPQFSVVTRMATLHCIERQPRTATQLLQPLLLSLLWRQFLCFVLCF
jgi:hypothetical protein